MKPIKKNRVIKTMERQIARGEAYIERGVNIESDDWLHLSDWHGNSGHPLWMKNTMIPFLHKQIAKYERIMENSERRVKDYEVSTRRQRPKNTPQLSALHSDSE